MSDLPTLHIANKNYSSWSLRPWILLRELNVPFIEQLHPFGSEPFTGFSPSGQVPCLEEGTLTIWDSLAITEHVAEQTPAVWPSQLSARAWARSATAEMHSGFDALRQQCSMSCGIRVELHRIDLPLSRDLARLDALWTEGLERFGGPFLAGSAFTAVDAFYAPVAFRVQTYGIALSAASLNYAARLRDRPAMAEWYEAALVERWREASHEEHVHHWGAVTEDLRAR